MNAFVDPEELVICPYDKSHSIMKSKLHVHLVRCRKNHPNSAIAICDYNQEHRIPKPELKYHHEVCEYRLSTEARSSALQGENVMSFPISDVQTPTVEKWTTGLNYGGYNSAKVTENENILRVVNVEKPSTKKQFRVEEQRRMNAIRAPSAASTSQGESSGSSNVQGESSGSSNASSVCEEFVDEDKPECSLVERIRKGDKTVYDPTPEESEWTTKKNRRKK